MLVRHPSAAFASEARIAEQWQELNYRAAPALDRAVAEFEQFVRHLTKAGAEVLLANGTEPLTLDALYVRDAAVITDAGAILCAMGKPARAGEPAALRTDLTAAGIALLGAIEGAGRLEGGDVCWLPGNRLAVGRGYRTNDEGIRQLRALLRGCTDEVVEVPLPHWRGPSDVFHLMSILSPLDADLALVFSPLLPVPFRERLLAMGIALVDVPDAEFETLGCNVLALGPRHCLMTEGNPVTQSRMEAAGVRVVTFPGEEICRKGGGGPTCLTRPLAREG